MKINGLMPIGFLFFAWLQRQADGSCEHDEYSVKNIRDVAAIDRPYIVSDASDWNAAEGRFDSRCGARHALAALVSLIYLPNFLLLH